MGKDVIKSAKRIFEVLEYFEDAQGPLTLKLVSSSLRYPTSSAAALLKSMVTLGYLDYDGFTRTYLPTMRMAKLGHWVEGAFFGEGAVLKLMTRLNRLTKETISLITQSDLSTQYIHVLPSLLPIINHLKPGMMRPLARTGMGWLMLSARDDETIAHLLRRFNAAEKDRSKRVALNDLMVQVGKVRKQGYVIARHTVFPGGAVIGMLLPERRHGRLLAIGVHGPEKRLYKEQDRIIAELRDGMRKLRNRDTA